MAKETDATEVSLGAETAKATAAKFSMAAIGFVGTIIFARILGPEKFGAYYLLFALVKIADLPVEGWSMAAKKRFSEDGAQTPEIVGGQYLFVLGWVTVGTVGALLTDGYIVSYTGVAAVVPLFVALLGSEAVYVSAERLLQSRGLVGKATWMDALRSYVTFGLQLALVLAGWGVAGMAYGLAAATLLVTPITLYFVGVRPTSPSREALASQWEYARYSLLSTLFGRVYERFDVLLLGYLIGPTAAGWYEVAYKLVTPAKFVAEAASSGLMARVSHLTSRGEEVGVDVTNVLTYASILSIPIFFGALAISETLVTTIYGIEYAGAAPLLVVIALYHVVVTRNMPLVQTAYGLDLPRRVTVNSVIGLTINIVSGVVLTLHFGAVGVAVATLLAELEIYAYYVFLVRKLNLNVNFLTRPTVIQTASGVASFVVVSVLHRSIRLGAWSTLLLLVGSGGLVYFVALTVFDGQARATARTVLREIFGRSS